MKQDLLKRVQRTADMIAMAAPFSNKIKRLVRVIDVLCDMVRDERRENRRLRRELNAANHHIHQLQNKLEPSRYDRKGAGVNLES